MKRLTQLIAVVLIGLGIGQPAQAVPHMKKAIIELQKVVDEIINDIQHVPAVMRPGVEKLVGSIELCIPTVDKAINTVTYYGHSAVKAGHPVHSNSHHEFLHQTVMQMDKVLEELHQQVKQDKSRTELRKDYTLLGEVENCIPIIKGIAAVRDFGTKIDAQEALKLSENFGNTPKKEGEHTE